MHFPALNCGVCCNKLQMEAGPSPDKTCLWNSYIRSEERKQFELVSGGTVVFQMCWLPRVSLENILSKQCKMCWSSTSHKHKPQSQTTTIALTEAKHCTFCLYFYWHTTLFLTIFLDPCCQLMQQNCIKHVVCFALDCPCSMH